VVMTLLGPILPALSLRWALSDMQAGYLFFAQFATSCLGMLLSGVLVKRFGYRLTLMFGLFLMAAGVAWMARASWAFGLIAVCVFGFAFGTNTPAANLFVNEANAGKSASALNLLNSSWGIGAMACPLIVALAQRTQHLAMFLYGLAAALVILVICLSQVHFTADVQRRADGLDSAATSKAWSHRLLPIIATMFFIYVGTETAVGGWVASFARRVDPSSPTFWAITPSFFWGALLLGRVTAPLVLRRMKETRVATIGVALASTGVATLLIAKSMALVVAGASLCGFGLASVYPIQISLLSRWFGVSITRLSGFLFASGNFGGAVLPWLVGAVSTRVGSLRVGLTVPLLGGLSMLTFYLTHRSVRTASPPQA
jgi:MFS transporter, FHS family, glucose/mannose:H+ symporter